MRTLITCYLRLFPLFYHRLTSFDNADTQSALSSNSHYSHSVVNGAAHKNTLATDEDAITPPTAGSKEEKENCEDESFECLLQRAKYTLKLLRIAQQNDMVQLQQQRQAEGKPSPTTSSPRPNPAVEISSIREGSSQSQLNVVGETKEKHQLLYRRQQEEAAEEPKEQQQMEETRMNQQVEEEEEVTASTPSPKHLQESQRTAMDIFLSSPTAGNWNELVESMRQERDDSSSRRDLMNLIETITIHNKMDDYDDDDDDNSSVTLSLSSETPQLSQSQQSLQDTQRTAMESFLSSPTGLNWDDFVKSLGKERDDDIGSRTLKNRDETMPVKNATVDVSTRWRQRKSQQQNHNQSGPSRDRKGENSLERRIEQILTLTPTATISDTTCKAAGNVGTEMILNDLMTIDEDIALMPKSH